jgi:hypothetical protein
MALPLPPPTPATSNCSGLTYTLPLPLTHITYYIKIDSSPGPLIYIPITIPEIPIFIPFPKIFDRIPKIDNDCEKPRQDMIIPGVPCDASICNKRVCRRIFGRKFCVNIPYPCPRLRGQIYLEKDQPLTINLFRIPKIGLIVDANSSVDTDMTVELMSDTAIQTWINFLISSGISASGITDIKSVLDRLMITAKNTIGSLLILLSAYFIKSKIPITISIKIRKLILDIKWNVNYIKLYAGNNVIELRDLTYTFKDVDVLKLIQAEEISVKFSSGEIVFEHVLGRYIIAGGTPYTIITTMISDKISQLKSIPNWEQTTLKDEVNKLENALNYLIDLTNIIELIPGLNIPGLNYLNKLLDEAKVTAILSLRFCPLTGTSALCAIMGFDITNYLQLLGNFLKTDVKNGLNVLKKYDLFSNVLNIPELSSWNNT